MYKQIKLTQGKYTIVDDEDYEYLSQFSWHYHSGGYVERSVRFGKKKSNIMMHREILNIIDNHEKCVDHKNMNKLDNRKENLRIANKSLNSANTRKKANTTSKYKGVYKHTQTGRWVARGTINGKMKHLLITKDEKEAAKAYNEWAKKNFGQFARLNDV